MLDLTQSFFDDAGRSKRRFENILHPLQQNSASC
jgi:hypothetical protein